MRLLSSALIFLTTFCLAATAYAGLPATRVNYDNGFEAIFVENHSSPMITSIVFVNAGARYETEVTNGATHFLEHLLFNGTRKYTQEELDDLVERHGGYINAFTRKDLTAYLVLMPTEFIDYGLEAQSEQLFHSILPEDKFAKERKIVIEEIRMDDDNVDYLVDKFHNSIVYAGTPYARPVLGYEQLIAQMPREKILDYYQTYYSPNNMVALVIGDFQTEEFINRYMTYFGTPPRHEIPPEPEMAVTIPAGKRVVRKELDGEQCYLNFTSQAPLHSDPDYYAFYILNELLNDEALSPLVEAIKGGEKPLAQSVSTSIYTQKDFCHFNVYINSGDPDGVDQLISTVNQTMQQQVANWQPQQEHIDAIVVSEKTEEIYLREKLHYYGFIIAPLMVSTGYDFIDNLTVNLEQVTAADLARVANNYFRQYDYVATVVTPEGAGYRSEQTEIHSDFLQRTMANGLEVVIKSNAYSEVQAFMVLGKNRSACEPQGKAGITDFVNRMLDKGTANYNKEELSHELQSIGANLTVHDNPYIPYDDRYTSHRFSFVKFETISDYTDRGIELLAEMIARPTFPESEIEQVRGEMMQVLGMKSASTYQQARDLYYQLLFGDSPYGRPIEGSHRTIGMITADDLREYHRRFYSPGNLVLTIVTDLEPEVMYDKLEQAFAGMATAETPRDSIESPVTIIGELHDDIPADKKQTYIYLGGPVCSNSDPDAVPLRVATEILSSNLAQNLREEQGLAYRIGAGLTLDRDFGWYSVGMGTGTENYEVAKAGILAELERLKIEPVTTEQVEKAVNSLWGSMLTARLSRINQAFYMAVNEFVGLGYDYQEELIAALREVTPEQIQQVAQKYFDTENYVLATVGAPK
jgi:predicted Zn-dependent peptidase